MEYYRTIIQSKYRTAWFVVVVVALTFAVYITLLGWNEFNESPTFTTLYSQKYPIWEVDFPGVTLCSINRISLKAVNEYAAKLAAKDPHLNTTYLLNNLRHLGYLIDFTNNFDLEYFQFQDLLDRLDPDEELGVNDIRKTMEMLAPQCSDLILKCRWEDREIDCNEKFMLRRTAQGYCCSYNYVRSKSVLSDESKSDPLRAYQTGMDKGLIVVLNTSTADYFFSLRSTIGVFVGIHNPSNFPDSTNGNYHQFLVPQSTEAFLKLDVATIKTDEDVARYALNKRGCLFSFERNTKFGGHYSYADCILRCKIYNFLYLCDCIPYFFPTNFPDFGDNIKNATRCNLTHLKCLGRYASTLITLKPKKLIEGLERDFGDAIDCQDCYPLCSLSRYMVQATYSALAIEEVTGDSWGIMKGVLNQGNVKDVSILRVYYPLVSTLLYKSGVVYTWHEIISEYNMHYHSTATSTVTGKIRVRESDSVPCATNKNVATGALNSQHIERIYKDTYSISQLSKAITVLVPVLWGYFGGLLSLCIGFSTISVMEIVYFATVRLYQNIFIKPKTEKKTTSKFTKNTTYKDMEIILVKEYAHHRK